MVSRTLSPCSHGWVDERAAPPHLVTSPLLQSPADVLETQQTVLTVFPRVRLHPFSSSLFNIVSMGIKNSEHHSLRASLNFGPQFNALENTMRAFLGTNLNINPRSWVCHQRLSGFAIYFTFSIIGYSKRRRHRSQKPIHSGPNKWIFIGSLVCIWLSLGSINPQIVKPHWPQPLALRKNRPLGMELWKFLENLLSEISPKSKEFMMDQQRMIWHLMIRERHSYFRTCRPIHQVLNNHPLSPHCLFHNMNFKFVTNASLAVG